MIINKQQLVEFEEAVTPLMEWIKKNCHPHCTIILDSERCQLVEGIATAINKSQDTEAFAIASK